MNYATYKNDLGAALTAYFKDGHVTRGNKAFDIKENTYRISRRRCAMLRIPSLRDGRIAFKGTAFDPDNGGRIQNWPDQHYDNGVSKNTATGGRFKDVVRILKRFATRCAKRKIAAATPIPSFLVECLVWNAPNSAFGYETYTTDVREVLANLFNDTIKFETCSEWGEINELKYLFRAGQPWTLTQAHAFISALGTIWGFD